MESRGKVIHFRKMKRQKGKKKLKNFSIVFFTWQQSLILVGIDTSTHFVHYNAGKYVK